MTGADEVSTADRLTHRLGSNMVLIVAASVLLAAVGGFVAYQSFTGPNTTTEQRTVATVTTESEFTHGAVVQRDTRAFDTGTVLRNRSVYFTSVAPVLNGTYSVRHSGDADPAAVETDLLLVVRAVERGSEESVLWSVSERVASERSNAVAAGEEFVVPYRFNVSEQRRLAQRVRSELGSTRGQLQVRLVAQTDVTATVDGEQFEETRTETLEVVPQSDSYGVTIDTAGVRRESVVESVTVPVEPDPVREYGSLLALVLGLIGLGLVVAMERTGRLDVDPETRAAIRAARERDSFDEWISTGRLPPVGDERVVTVASLEDLVDVAIDSDRRVVEDSETTTYAVLDGDTRYEYRPGGSDTVATGTRTNGDQSNIVGGADSGLDGSNGASESGDGDAPTTPTEE